MPPGKKKKKIPNLSFLGALSLLDENVSSAARGVRRRMRWKDRVSENGWRQQQLAFHEEQHHVVTHGQVFQLGFLLSSEDSRLWRSFKSDTLDSRTDRKPLEALFRTVGLGDWRKLCIPSLDLPVQSRGRKCSLKHSLRNTALGHSSSFLFL